MMLLQFTQDESLPLFQKAIRDQLQRGGTYKSVLLTFAGLAALVLLVYVLQRWLDRIQSPRDEVSHPTRLFRQLLGKMNLTPTDQDIVLKVADHCEIENPTAMLISRELFDQHTTAWKQSRTGEDTSPQIEAIRRKLF